MPIPPNPGGVSLSFLDEPEPLTKAKYLTKKRPKYFSLHGFSCGNIFKFGNVSIAFKNFDALQLYTNRSTGLLPRLSSRSCLNLTLQKNLSVEKNVAAENW